MAARIAMMAITTNSSIKVKPAQLLPTGRPPEERFLDLINFPVELKEFTMTLRRKILSVNDPILRIILKHF